MNYKELFETIPNSFVQLKQDFGYLSGAWHKSDIETWLDDNYPDIDYTNEDIDIIAYDIEKYSDAQYGISWDTIDFHIQDHFKPKKT